MHPVLVAAAVAVGVTFERQRECAELARIAERLPQVARRELLELARCYDRALLSAPSDERDGTHHG